MVTNKFVLVGMLITSAFFLFTVLYRFFYERLPQFVEIVGGAIWEIGMIPAVVFTAFAVIYSVIQLVKGRFTWSLGIALGLALLVVLYMFLAD